MNYAILWFDCTEEELVACSATQISLEFNSWLGSGSFLSTSSIILLPIKKDFKAIIISNNNENSFCLSFKEGSEYLLASHKEG